MTNCTNCTVVVPAVWKTCTIDKCDKMIVSVACCFLRVGSCIDSKIYTYSVNIPFLFGDNWGVILAPYNIGYKNLSKHLEISEIKVSEAFI